MIDKIKKIVIISYNFPPVGGAGVQRPVKFVKYLRQFGWEPVVLTVANPSVPVIDESLMRDIPNDVAIYKAKTLEPSYAQKQALSVEQKSLIAAIKRAFKNVITNCMLPDLQILWWPDLIFKLLKIIKNEKPNCLFVTAPPFSSFLPVIFLGSIFKVPVIIDFRDEWAFSRNTWENSAKHMIATTLDKLFERYAVHNCSAFTAANMSYIETICETHRGIDKKKGFVITNGYDEDDFAPTSPKATSVLSQDKINIVYTGTVWNATSFRPFITALKSVLLEAPSIASKIHIKIYGRVVGPEKEYFNDTGIESILELYDYCSHDLAVQAIRNADILVLTISDLPGSQKIIAGKIFEYMATGKHILAIIPDGETKKIIVENYGNFSIVKPGQHDVICKTILSLISNIEVVRNSTGYDVSQFSRKRLTEKLVEVFAFCE